MPSNDAIVTLALRYLIESRKRRLERISKKVLKSKTHSLDSFLSPDDVLGKKFLVQDCLADNIRRKSELCYAQSGASGEKEEVARDLEKEVQRMKDIKEHMIAELKRIEDDMALMRKKKDRMERMEHAYLEAMKRRECGDYSMEYATLKRTFHEVKEDLYTVVESLFPDDMLMKNTFAELTSAYAKGGDDLYINVTPETFSCISFLVGCDVAQYHRNDKTKVKFVDMM